MLILENKKKLKSVVSTFMIMARGKKENAKSKEENNKKKNSEVESGQIGGWESNEIVTTK